MQQQGFTMASQEDIGKPQKKVQTFVTYPTCMQQQLLEKLTVLLCYE